jgi:hypothetical protein
VPLGGRSRPFGSQARSTKTPTMKTLIVALLLSCAAALLAQAPIPKALKEAKTAYLVNEGVKGETFARLAKELRSWNRFSLVDDASKADVIISMKHPIGPGGAYLSVVSTSDHTTLWGQNSGLSWSEGTMASKLVKNLREDLDRKFP